MHRNKRFMPRNNIIIAYRSQWHHKLMPAGIIMAANQCGGWLWPVTSGWLKISRSLVMADLQWQPYLWPAMAAGQ